MIVKRDGRQVKFNERKIEDAMMAAFNEVYQGKPEYSDLLIQYKTLIKAIAQKAFEICKYTDINVERIQDLVIDELWITFPTVASAYKQYRINRTKIREKNGVNYKNAMKKLKGIEPENLNANVDDKCFSGRLKGFLEVHYKPAALDMMPEEFAKAHLEFLSYVHDLDSYGLAHNCLSLPLDDLLNKHTHIKQTDLRPARSISSALQMTAVFMQLQSLDMFGGVSATHIDTTMVPFFRHSFYKHFNDGLRYVENRSSVLNMTNNVIKGTSIDDEVYKSHYQAYNYALDMTVKETYQGIEALFHNLKIIGATCQ